MKNQDHFTPDDQLLRDLFKESEAQPGASLKEQIMLNIEQSKPMEYEPVISTRAWWMIGIGFLSFLIYLIFGYKGDSGKSYFDIEIPSIDFSKSLEWLSKVNVAYEGVNLQMPEIHFSVLMGLSALILVGVSFIISYQTRIFHS